MESRGACPPTNFTPSLLTLLQRRQLCEFTFTYICQPSFNCSKHFLEHSVAAGLVNFTMTNSSKKKKEKKQDFQKPKLKVGKARPKNTNATDTSFAAKCECQCESALYMGILITTSSYCP